MMLLTKEKNKNKTGLGEGLEVTGPIRFEIFIFLSSEYN